ncbi:MAG: hypothetical protein ABSB58_09675 [Gemmatimonadales bacterium]|jgi:Spy/CpxP family protein refolding chaperone
MTGATFTRTATLVAGGLVLAAALAAQQPPAAAPGQNPPRPTVTQAVGGGTAAYLVQNPQVLQLTPEQVQRVAKVANRVDSINTPVRNRMQAVTGGRRLVDMTPAERRRVGPQLRPLLQQLQANNETSLDSIEGILTPEQTTHLEALRAEYKERIEARRAAMAQRRRG